jgi:predicted phage tail protein
LNSSAKDILNQAKEQVKRQHMAKQRALKLGKDQLEQIQRLRKLQNQEMLARKKKMLRDRERLVVDLSKKLKEHRSRLLSRQNELQKRRSKWKKTSAEG